LGSTKDSSVVGVYSASMTLLPFSFSHLSHKLA
jgi:hypothetical protein